MISTSTAIKATCELAYPRDRVFAHWTSPVTRARWEAGPDTNLRYKSFDMREGGEEVVHIMSGDTQVGKMVQRINALIDAELLATSTTYFVGDEATMMMQLALEFEDGESGGCLVTALAQVIDLTGANLTEEHKSGWEWIFARFEGDIKTNGLIEI